MPRRFRRSRRSGTSRPVRNREWLSFTTGETYQQPRQQILFPGDRFAAWAIDPGQALALWDEPTIVRLLLVPTVYVHLSTAQATAEYRQTLRGGFLTWKGSTVGEITGELDGVDPQDGSLDWMWWAESHFGHWDLKYLGSSAHNFSGTGGVVDVRAKRKLELGYGLVGAWECVADGYPAAAAFAGISFHMAGRVLLMNH